MLSSYLGCRQWQANMAKLLLFVLLVGITVCHGDNDRPLLSYTRGHEYVYDYETQIMSGLPEGSKIYSGLKLVTKVYFQMVGTTHFKMQFHNPKLYKINGLLDTYDPTMEMIPTDAFTELLNDDAIFMKKELVKPCSFTYSHGHVDDVMTEGSDPEWSVNIKKGCLNLLEMNFNARNTLSPSVDLKTPYPYNHVYRVFEPCVAGNCETTYRVLTTNNDENTPVMKLEKVRNFENCVNRVMYMADMFRGMACEYCHAEMSLDTFTAQSMVRYEMTGTPEAFMIVTAVAESMYAFVPYTEHGGKVMTFTNQTFTLVDMRETIEHELPSPTSPQQHRRPLQAVKSPREDKLNLQPIVMDKGESHEIVLKAIKMLKGVAMLNKDKIDYTSNEMIKEMWWLFRQLDRQGWTQLMDEVMKKSFEPKNSWKILIDMIPTIGTFESVDFLLYWMENNRVAPEVALTSYMALSLIPDPDLITVEGYINHMKKFHKEPENKHLFRTAFLCLGSFGMKARTINNTFVKELKKEMTIQEVLAEKSNLKQDHINLEFLRQKLEKTVQLYSKMEKEIITLVEDLYNKEKKWYRILALRVMYNLRFEHFVPMLEKLATDKTEVQMLRHEAIDNLMRFDYDVVMRDRVRGTVLPIFFDTTEPDELRLIAFVQILMSGPTKPELEMIAKSLYFEPSKNVGCFVWDALVVYSNFTTTCNCVKSLAHNTTLALRFAKKPEETFKYSSFWAFGGFDKTYNRRYRNYDMVMFSPEERFPTSFASFGQTTFFGRSAWLYGFLFRGKGLDTLAESLYRSPEMSVLKNFVSPKFKRSVSENAERIQELKEKLEIKPRAPIIPEGVIDIQLFDQTIFYFDLEPFLDLDPEELRKEIPESQMKTLQKKVVKALPEMLSVLGSINKFLSSERTFFLPFMHFMMPTEVGLPMHIAFDWHGAFKFDGEMNVKSPKQAPPHESFLSRMGFTFDFKPSGMLVSSTDMMVDMKYFHSGFTSQETFYMDMPFTMEFGGSMDKTKFHMKITDLTQERPFMYEGLSHTFVYNIPYHAAMYPQPVDKKLIVVTADADITMYSYEIGKEYLGIQYMIEGEWSRPKSMFVEQFPLCGKRTMYVKFDPLQAKEIDINFQHTQEYVRDRQEKDASSSWMISRAFNWLFNGEEKPREEPVEKERADEQPERPPLQPAEQFIDLDQTDLTLPYLERRFKDDVTLLESGWKCGMAVTIITPGQPHGHKVQFTTLYQMEPNGFTHFYTMDLCHFTPQNPNKPWKMVASTKFSLPSTLIEPSSLLDNEYQRQVQEEISKELARDETDPSTQFDVSYYIMVNSIKQLLVSEKRDMDPRVDILLLINHILEQSVSLQLERLETLVQDQRRLEREARLFTDRPIDVLNVEKLLSELMLRLKRAGEVSDKLLARLNNPGNPHQLQMPQEAVMMHYLIISQTNTLSELGKVVRKLNPILGKPRSGELVLKLERLMEKLADIVNKQLRESSRKQETESQRAEIEVEKSERGIHAKLIKVEKKLVSALGKLVEPESLSHERKPFEHLPELLDIAEQGERITSDVESHLEKTVKIDKVVRVKMAEVLLQITQLTQMIDTMVAEMNSGYDVHTKPAQAPLPDLKILEQKKKLLNLKIQLQQQVEALTRYILLAVNVEKEMKYLSPILPSGVENDVRSLNSIMVKQTRLLASLRQPSQNENRLEVPLLQNHMKMVTEMNVQLHGIIVKNVLSSGTTWKISPIMLKSIWLIADQLEILDLLRIPVEEKLEIEAVSGRDVASVKALHKDVMTLLEETLRASSKIIQGLSPPSSGDRLPRDDLEKLTPSLSSLVKQSARIDAKHLMVKSEARRLSSELKKIPASPEKPAAEPVMLKQQLYQMLQRVTDLLVEAESLHSRLSSELARKPTSENLHELLMTVEQRLEQLLDVIRTVEEPLKDLSPENPSFLKPLQNLQKLKDRVQRKIHAAKLARTPEPLNPLDPGLVADKPHQEPRKPVVPRPIPPRQPSLPLPRDFISAIRGETTIVFGPEGGVKKTIFFKLMGKKSLQQLLWEREQILPSKQDPIVQRYMSDKEVPNDRTAMQYREIKAELNSYRHVHFFCTYEETIPFTIKNYMFRFHQFVKYFLYDQAFVSLPSDTTPLMNKFEVVMDFDRDDRWMSMRIDTASEMTRVDYLEVPLWFRMTMFPASSSIEETMIAHYVGNPVQACYVSPRRIKTFDGERLMPELESMPCESVLAMDCSPNNEFMITKQPKSAGLEKIMVVTKQHRLDVIRKSDGRVVVNNDDSPLNISVHPVVLEKEGASIHVSQINNHAVLIMIPGVGIHVATDGERAALMVSQSHKSRVCGLCGNMDGRNLNDLAGAQTVLYPGARSMASTFLVPSDTCPVKDIQKHLNVEEIRQKSTEKIQPMLHTDVFTTEKASIPIVCFSTTPIRRCPTGSKPTKTTSHVVEYVCLKHGRKARKLREQAEVRVVKDMESKSAYAKETRTLNEPMACIKI